ncbi:MAG: hypothetical protein ABIR46_03375 [Candidatus Saccharimonadales bacterium]
MLDFIGPNTWAVVIGLAFVVLGGFLTTRGVMGKIVGTIIFAVAVGVVVGILFTQGFMFPGTTIPIGYAATLAAAMLSGVTMIAEARKASSQSGGNWRDRVPQYDGRSISLLVVGAILVGVPVTVALSNLDFNSGKSGAGFNIFSADFEQQNHKFMRSVEKFLAK